MSERVRGELEYQRHICAGPDGQNRWEGLPLKMCSAKRKQTRSNRRTEIKKGFNVKKLPKS